MGYQGYSDLMGNGGFWNGGTYDGTYDWLKGFNSANGFNPNNRDMNAARSNAFYQMLTGGEGMNPNSWYSRASQAGNSAQGLLEAMANSANASNADITNNWLASMPGMQDYARRVADQSQSMQQGSADNLARELSRQSMRQMEAKLGGTGLGSGAALGALAAAQSSPLLQTLSQLATNRAQTYENTLNPLAQASYARAANRTGEYGQALSGALGAVQGYGGLGQGLAGFMNDQSQQQLIGPDLRQRTGMWEQLGTAAIGGLANGLGAGLTSGNLGKGLWEGGKSFYQRANARTAWENPYFSSRDQYSAY